LPGADEEHRIPSGYWKINIIQDNPTDPSTLHCQAWILDQDTPRNADYRTFAVSIDEIERRTGLDVLWKLEDGLENKIEAK